MDEKKTESPFARTALMLGDAAMQRLSQCRVAVFGIGGVGGYVVEALARSGVGALDLIDNDTAIGADTLYHLRIQLVGLVQLPFL